ncbi:MAG: hypothetical protein A2675_02150 [Candidatus Yonathbacteria bacterium RIFCSPHIGHO2_01_FULL_51_10]|uniref:Uncharacterized protein n=1 Tax=Candidatus Yonathbacteria bacterium RIFCSPHIGHO2_01_FULL_51_10 TaxID=1802723 RepID=A0A1G2S6X3_9BACT|nr:MAG: hypothetical protein A2675_02150 [Candidatus Yonathbacteria bacterium RIFCSPHIGHO2_01_FULL_51_10]
MSQLQANTITAVLQTLDSFSSLEMIDRRLLVLLLEEGTISRDILLKAADQKLRKVGRTAYVQHITSMVQSTYTIWPDHTLSAEAFAYALAHGEFTKNEERRIRFDHGDTIESFIASSEYAVDHLCQKTVDQWLDITPPPEHKWPKGDHDSYCPGCD